MTQSKHIYQAIFVAIQIKLSLLYMLMFVCVFYVMALELPHNQDREGFIGGMLK